MKTASTCFLLLAASLLTTMPGRAQLAYGPVALPAGQPQRTTTAATAAPRSTEPRVVYGVVQGLHGVLPGATVWLHGSRTVAVANSEGVFELPVPTGTNEVEVTCSYVGLREEVLTLPVAEPGNTVYLLRAQTPSGKHFVSDLTLKDRYDLLTKKARAASR